MFSYGPEQYAWIDKGEESHPGRDLPPLPRHLAPGALKLTLAPSSITVVVLDRARIGPARGCDDPRHGNLCPRRAAGYSPGPKGPINTGFIHMTIPHAAGALYSTTEDLLRWEQGLYAGKVVTPASLEKMTTPFKNDYAFGVNVRMEKGRKLVQHGGGIEGFNTALAYYPETGTTVVVPARLGS